MMNKKAQEAMEFLMTYGWAILVVLVAIGAVAYFYVPASVRNPVQNNATQDVQLQNVTVCYKYNVGGQLMSFSELAIAMEEETIKYNQQHSTSFSSSYFFQIIDNQIGYINIGFADYANNVTTISKYPCVMWTQVQQVPNFERQINFTVAEINGISN
jgi:hypothetical protein